MIIILLIKLLLIGCFKSNPKLSMVYKPNGEKNIRKSFDDETIFKAEKALEEILSLGYELGEAYDNGDCFFDSLVQILDNKFTVKELRTICYEYYNENKKEVDEWIKNDSSSVTTQEDYTRVQETSEESEEKHGKPPIWGRPVIEGRILCNKIEELDRILVIELIQAPQNSENLIKSSYSISKDGYENIKEEEVKNLIQKNKIPILINIQEELHFVPLLKENKNFQNLVNSNFRGAFASSFALDSVNPTFQKLELIRKSIANIEEISSDIKENIDQIKEEFLKISWRSSEIPSSDKFKEKNKALGQEGIKEYFPERNWILLDYLAEFLNSLDGEKLVEAIDIIKKDLPKIKEGIIIVEKILRNSDLESKTSQIKLENLESIVGDALDKELLDNINRTVKTILEPIKYEKTEDFIKNESNRRAIFRTLEIIGEATKNIRKETRKKINYIPWFEEESLKKAEKGKNENKNLLTDLRNKLHHDRDKIELILYYEEGLLNSILEDLFPIFVQGTDSLLANQKTSQNYNLKEDEINIKKTQVARTLQQILEILKNSGKEKKYNGLSGIKIRNLLSYLKEKEKKNIYEILLKKVDIPKTIEEFLIIVSQALEINNLIQINKVNILKEFQKAYNNLKGKILSLEDINSALEDGGYVPNVKQIKNKIEEVTLRGKPCKQDDFKNNFLSPIFFVGIGQKDGCQKLEEIRSKVATDISKKAIDSLFEFDGDTIQAIEKNSKKALEDSNQVLIKLKEKLSIINLNKEKIDIYQLIGLNKKEKDELYDILFKKEPIQEPDEEAIKSKILKDLKLNKLGDQKIIIGKLSLFSQITGITIDESTIQKIVKRVMDTPLKDGGKNKEFIKAIFEIPGWLESEKISEIKVELKSKQRTQEDINRGENILSKVLDSEEKLKKFQIEVQDKIKKILYKEIDNIDEENFYYFIQVGCYPENLVNKIKQKYNKICTNQEELRKELQSIIEKIDTKNTPFSYLQVILNNEWLLDPNIPEKNKNNFEEFIKGNQFNKGIISTIEDKEQIQKELIQKINCLYEKKLDHILEQVDIDEVISYIESKKERYNEKGIENINELKEDIKKIPFISQESFQKLVKKAGYSEQNYKEKFEYLYKKITRRIKSIVSLEFIKNQINIGIEKLNKIFEDLNNTSLSNNQIEILKLDAEYLLEEIGGKAEELVARKDYKEANYLCLSRRNMHILGACRKAMAHLPLEINEDLKRYFIDQLVLDTKIRINKKQKENEEKNELLSKENMFFKTKILKSKDLEEKRLEIYSLVEGLGFKNNFKVFGGILIDDNIISLGKDYGVQGDLNFIVEPENRSEIKSSPQHLIDLEIRLSKVLNADIRVYTKESLQERLKKKVTQDRIEKLINTPYILEDVIRGSNYLKIFKEERWSSFRLSIGEVILKNDYLQGKDLEKLFSFFFEKNLSKEDLLEKLFDKTLLCGAIYKKLEAYNNDPEKYSRELLECFKILSYLISTYITDFKTFKIPIDKEGNEIKYYFLTPALVTILEIVPLNYLNYHFEPVLETKILKPLEYLENLLSKKEYENLSLEVQKLYFFSNKTKTYYKCTERFKSIREKIANKNKIDNLEKKAKKITDFIIEFQPKITSILSNYLKIDIQKFFEALTVDYAYDQKILQNENQAIKEFREKRLKDNPDIEKIIKNKASLYFDSIRNVLKSFSEEQNQAILEMFYFDKKIDQILSDYFYKNQEEITYYWHIMDEKQKEIFCEFHSKDANFLSQITINFEHFIEKIKNISLNSQNLKFLIRVEEINKKVTKLKKKINKKMKKLRGLIPKSNQKKLNFNNIIQNLETSNSENPTSDAAYSFYKKYSIMFKRITSHEIIEAFKKKDINENYIKDLIFNDLKKQFCQKGSNISFGKKKLTDFSTEVEYELYLERNYKKKELEQNSQNFPAYLKNLIEEGKLYPLELGTTILGFKNSMLEHIHKQISLHANQRQYFIPYIKTEDLPSFEIINNIDSMIVSSETKSASMFKVDIKDLNNLMEVHGWSEEQKKKYKKNNDFDRDNKLIADYYIFRRIYDELKAALQRCNEYNKKSENLRELKNSHHELSYKSKLEKEEIIYQKALNSNSILIDTLKKDIIDTEFFKGRITGLLREPDIIVKILSKCKQLSNSQERENLAKELLGEEKENLIERALQELMIEILEYDEKEEKISTNDHNNSSNILNEDLNIEYSEKNLETIKCLEVVKFDDSFSSILSKKGITITYLNSANAEVSLRRIKDTNVFLSYENWKDENIIEDEIIIYKKDKSYYIVAIYPVDHSYSVSFKINNREVLRLNFNTKYSFVKEIKDLDKWPGLVNIDNTCFLNSFLKAFSAIKSINELLENEDLSYDINIDIEKRLRFLRCFKALISSIREADKSALKEELINRVLIEKFSSYFNYLSKENKENFIIGSSYNDNGFRDVSEFIKKFISFIGALSKNTGKTVTKRYDENSNFISESTQSIGNTILLNIPQISYNDISVQDLIDLSNNSEDIIYNNKNATSATFINEFPDFLIVELKRFRNDRTKVNNKIKISRDIILKSLDEKGNASDSRKLILKSTIEHEGHSLNGDHYISYIFDNGVFKNNDNMEVVREPNFDNSAQTYIIIYEKE